MPERRDLDIAVIVAPAVFDNPSQAASVEGVFELPVGIACEVLAWRSSALIREILGPHTNEKLLPPWQLQHLPLQPVLPQQTHVDTVSPVPLPGALHGEIDVRDGRKVHV